METVQRKKGLSGSVLKLIAVITMTIDHFGAALLGRMLVAGAYQDFDQLYNIYLLTRTVGRVAFPIYCFLLVEGFLHTSDVKRYALRLGIFALVSEIPFDLVFSAKVLEFGYQNVYFTLLLGLLTMFAFDRIEGMVQQLAPRLLLWGVALAAGSFLGEFLRTDYGAKGVLCIMVLYLFRSNRTCQLLAGCVSFLWESPALFAFIPLSFYNGSRGRGMKYFFYLFYPGHLLLIYFAAWCMGLAGYGVV